MVRRVTDPRLAVPEEPPGPDELPEVPAPPKARKPRPWEYAGRRAGLKKPVSISVPLEDWKRLKSYAIFRKLTMTEVCRRLLEPGFQRLRDGDDPLAE